MGQNLLLWASREKLLAGRAALGTTAGGDSEDGGRGNRKCSFSGVAEKSPFLSVVSQKSEPGQNSLSTFSSTDVQCACLELAYAYP